MDDTITIFTEPIPDSDAEVLVGKVYYHKGGTNWYHGTSMPRGYRYAVNAEQHKDGMRSFVIDGNPAGRAVLLEEVKAFSAKKLAALAQDPTVLDKLQTLKAEVLARWTVKHRNGESMTALKA